MIRFVRWKTLAKGDVTMLYAEKRHVLQNRETKGSPGRGTTLADTICNTHHSLVWSAFEEERLLLLMNWKYNMVTKLIQFWIPTVKFQLTLNRRYVVAWKLSTSRVCHWGIAYSGHLMILSHFIIAASRYKNIHYSDFEDYERQFKCEPVTGNGRARWETRN